MAAAEPESLEFAEQLMGLSGGRAVANGLFAWLTTGATVNLLPVELGIGAPWLGMTVAIRTGRLAASTGATALALISVPVIGRPFSPLFMLAMCRGLSSCSSI